MVHQLKSDERWCVGRRAQRGDHPDMRQCSLHAVHLLLGQTSIGSETGEIVDVESVATLVDAK
eukprot:5899737-Pyramimonas_sp.AAC.1